MKPGHQVAVHPYLFCITALLQRAMQKRQMQLWMKSNKKPATIKWNIYILTFCLWHQSKSLPMSSKLDTSTCIFSWTTLALWMHLIPCPKTVSLSPTIQNWQVFTLQRSCIEFQFATNHVSHYYLTQLLLPLLEKSTPKPYHQHELFFGHHGARFYGGLQLDRINDEQSYSGAGHYVKSKAANILFTRELAKRLKNKGIDVCIQRLIITTTRYIDIQVHV